MSDTPRSRHSQCTPSFDRVARAYRWMEALSFGSALRHAREEYLPALLSAQHALVLGDGDGRFLSALLRRNPTLSAVAVDSSTRMLQLLGERCAFAGDRLTLLLGDLRDPTALLPKQPVAYDLVVSHFVLDCLDQELLTKLARSISPQLRPHALWVVSEFRVPPRGPGRLPAKLLIRLLYSVFGLLTGLTVKSLPPHSSILEHAGFHLIQQRLRLGGLLSAELWQAGPVA